MKSLNFYSVTFKQDQGIATSLSAGEWSIRTQSFLKIDFCNTKKVISLNIVLVVIRVT